MKVDKIAQLFAPQSERALAQQPQIEATKNGESALSSEAVSVSPGLQAQAQNDSDSKVARIKAAIENGSYNVSSREIGAAVYKELFI